MTAEDSMPDMPRDPSSFEAADIAASGRPPRTRAGWFGRVVDMQATGWIEEGGYEARRQPVRGAMRL